jgi:hypothetical protein
MKFYATLVTLLCISLCLDAFTLSMRNRIAAINTVYLQTQKDQYELAVLWQPEFNLDHSFSPDLSMTGQLMGNGAVRQVFQSGDDYFVRQGKIQRLWLALGSPQTEARIGLQRMNFGSAQILRPLQWFDNLDPKDKLELTDGVQAILVRHYFLNNANLWVWGVRGEEKLRGQLLTLTKDNTPEVGGRVQYPFFSGEIALTANHRQETVLQGIDTGSESRIGLDCRQDWLIGLWMELYGSFTQKPAGFGKYQAPVTFGIDYTFNLGNGVYTLAETQVSYSSDVSWSELHSDQVTAAVSASYPLGLLDRVIYYGTFTEDGNVSVQSAIWRREYDRLSWDLSLFWDAGKRHYRYNSRGIKALISYTF